MNELIMPKVVAVVPIHNGRDELFEFLESITSATYPNLEVIVVDDGSTDDSAEAIAAHYPKIRVLKGDGNLWWSGATNLGVMHALSRDADFVLTINNDDLVESGFIEPLVETAVRNPHCLVNSVLYDYKDRNFICSFGGKIEWFMGEIRDRNSKRDKLDYGNLCEVDFLTGNSTLVPIDAYLAIGIYDQVNCPQYIGDAEFSLRARNHGYRLLLEPRSVVYQKTWNSGGAYVLNNYSLYQLVTSIRSPFYFRANYKLYREHCPYWPVLLFLGIRYLRLLYSFLRRRFIDKNRS